MDNSVTDANFKILADYQDALIEHLHCNSGELSLIPDSRFKPFQSYISGFSADMIELARELLIKWGVNKK